MNAAPGRVHLRLFVAGAGPRSLRAVANIKQVCEARLAGCYQLEVIDLYQQPQLAETEQIIAVPTLVRLQPLPRRRLIGDLSETARVLEVLDLAADQ